MKILITQDWVVKPASFVQPELFREFYNVVKDYCTFDGERKVWRVNSGCLRCLITQIRISSWQIESPHDLSISSLSATEKNLRLDDQTVKVSMVGARVSFVCKTPTRLFHDIFSSKTSYLTGICEQVYGAGSYATSSFPLALEAIKVLLDNGFRVLKGSTVSNAENAYRELEAAYASQDPEITRHIANDCKLFQHQNKAVAFLEKTKGRALLGCAMGSGKTLIALSYAAKHNLRVAVIGPKTTRRTWINEAKKFFLWEGCEIGSDCDNPKNLSQFRIVSTNYDGCKKFGERLKEFDLLVIDESHNISNVRAKRTELVTEISKSFEKVILLSGTAIKNKRAELFPQLRIIDPHNYKKELTGEYSAAMQSPEGAFWESLQRIYLSMTKSEVLFFLPAKTTVRRDLPVAHPTGLPTCLEEMTAFKHLAAQSKIETTCDLIQEILDSSDDAVLIGSEFRDVCEAIAERFASEAILHTGQMGNEDREAKKTEFQTGGKRLFVSTRPSLAEGATLTRACKVVFNDLPWNGATIQQFEDRTHRIGQHNPVVVYWVVASNSEFDSRLVDLISQKYELQKALTQGKTLSAEEREFLAKPVGFKDLFKNAKRKILDDDDLF